MHSFHKVHNVGKAAVQCNDHAFGKLYISLTEADILPVLGGTTKKQKKRESHTLEQSECTNPNVFIICVHDGMCMNEAFTHDRNNRVVITRSSHCCSERSAHQNCSRQKDNLLIPLALFFYL